MNQPVATKCPTCRNVGNWLAGKYAPFCSHRCKLIDLGGWLNEQHAIGSPLRPEQLEEYSEEPGAETVPARAGPRGSIVS